MFRGGEDAQTKYGGRKTHVMYSADLQRRSSRVWCRGPNVLRISASTLFEAIYAAFVLFLVRNNKII